MDARDACINGFNVLAHGGTACDAVEAALICLENNPVFDAGTGSVPDHKRGSRNGCRYNGR